MNNSLRGIAMVTTMLLAAGSAGAVDKVKWVNDWVPGGDKAPIYVGVHKGFFAAEGLEVDIAPGRGSADAITKVASGVAEVCTAGISALMQAAAEGGAPVKAIMSIYTQPPDAIFTSEGSGITTLKDLTGKAVATGTFSSSNVMWPLILKANGIDASKVEVLKVEPATLAPMLASGRVPATIGWVTTAPLFEKVLAQGGKKFKAIPWHEYGFESYAYSLFASDKMIKERPDVLKRFVRAYRKAIDAAIDDPKIAGESLKALVPESDQAVAEAQWRASIPLIANDLSKKYGMGAFDKARLKVTWTWVAQSLNMPESKLDPETIVDRSFVK